jgi:hypothetical protein
MWTFRRITKPLAALVASEPRVAPESGVLPECARWLALLYRTGADGLQVPDGLSVALRQLDVHELTGGEGHVTSMRQRTALLGGWPGHCDE